MPANIIPKDRQVRHRWQVEVKVLDAADGFPIDVIFDLARSETKYGLVTGVKVAKCAVEINKQLYYPNTSIFRCYHSTQNV